MRGFALSVLAFLTFGIFAYAAPTPITRDVANVNVNANTNVGADVRRSDNQCLDSILSEVISEVDHIIDEISELSSIRESSSCGY